MDNETSPGSYTSKFTSADKKLFNKPKKNLIQLIDFVGAVKNSINDKKSSCFSDNQELNENDQTSALVSGMCICKLFDRLYYYTYKVLVRLQQWIKINSILKIYLFVS